MCNKDEAERGGEVVFHLVPVNKCNIKVNAYDHYSTVETRRQSYPLCDA